MRKLVLGIIAVTLLQVAFFVLVGKDVADHTTVGEIAARADENGLELSRSDDAPSVIVPSDPSSLPAATVLERTNARAPSASGRPVPGTKSRTAVRRNQIARNPTGARSTEHASFGKFPGERGAAPRRVGVLIPRGYTMVLIDYPPAGSSNPVKKISKPRKRSYLARALPALVTKPWNCIKSIASKLD